MTRHRYYIGAGEEGIAEMPHSEVCCHMRVAGKPMRFRLLRSSAGYYSVQLFREDGSFFSSPITTGEAGIYREDGEDGLFQFYFYSRPELMEALCKT